MNRPNTSIKSNKVSFTIDSKLANIIFSGLVAVIIVAPLLFGVEDTWSLAIIKYLVLGILSLWVIKIVYEKELTISLNLPLLALFFYCLLTLLQLIPLPGIEPLVPFNRELATITPALYKAQPISLDPYATRQAGLKLLTLFFLFLVAHNFVTWQRSKRLIQIIVGLGFTISLIGLLQHFLTPNLIYGVYLLPPDTYAFGTFMNRNHFAGFTEMVMAFALTATFMSDCKLKTRFIYGIITMVMGISILLSGSRAGAIIMVVEFLLMALFLCYYQWKLGESNGFRLRTSLISITLILIGILALSYGMGMDNLLMRFATLAKYDINIATGGREQLWQTGWQLFLARPVWGCGLGGFALAYPYFATDNGRYAVGAIHNDYLQVLTDTGLMGGVLALVFVFSLLKAAYNQITKLSADTYMVVVGASIAIIAMSLHSGVDFNLQIGANALLFLVITNFLFITPRDN